MSDPLCIIYEVDVQPEESACQIASDYYPTKKEAVRNARIQSAKVYRIEVSGEGGLRRAACRLAKSKGYVQNREEVGDFTDHQHGEQFEN